MPEVLEGVIAAEKATAEKRAPKRRKRSELSTSDTSQLLDPSMEEYDGEHGLELDG